MSRWIDKHHKPIGAALIVLGLAACVEGVQLDFIAGYTPDWLRVAIGIALILAGYIVMRVGWNAWRLPVLVALAAALMVSGAGATTTRAGEMQRHFSGAHGCGVYDNVDAAHGRLVGREFSTHFKVTFCWNYKRRTVQIKGYQILPDPSSLGRDEGWDMDRTKLVANTRFAVVKSKKGKPYPHSGAGIEVMVHWSSHCPLRTCGANSVYRYMRTFVYFDGNVQRKNTSSP